MTSTLGLLGKVWRLKDLRLFEDLRLDGVWVELDVESPRLDLVRLGDHLVEGLDGLDTVLRLLEETLTHIGNSLLVFSDFLRDTDQHAQLWRQIDVLTLLLDFK